MATAPIALLDNPDRVRLALSPVRRQLLERLRQPASATELASEFDVSRQRLNYHLRALESARLLELVEERQRRGCIERVLVARANRFVVDPSVIGESSATKLRTAQDRFSANYLLGAAAQIVRDVGRMQGRAEEQGTRLLTFTVETEVTFGTPADIERFTSTLADLVARTAATFQAPTGRTYRVVVGGHPAPAQSTSTSVHAQARSKKVRRKTT